MTLLMNIAILSAVCPRSDAPSDEDAQETIRGIWLPESTIVVEKINQRSLPKRRKETDQA